MKDYYKTLELEKNASQEDIKKAFRRLAHKYHPDKPGGDEKKFKEVNEAYRVLSNSQKRAQYDQFGSAGPGAGFGGAHGFGGFDFSQFQRGADFDFDLGDIFSGAFGSGGFGGSRRRKRGQDIVTELVIDFEESVFGAEKKITIDHTIVCGECGGSGAEKGSGMEICPECKGSGKVQTNMMGLFAIAQTCPTCGGERQVPKNKCKMCNGAGIRREKDIINIKIPGGIKTGDNLRMSGRGEAIKNGQAGDLYIKIKVKSHKTFKRDGRDLRVDYEVSLKDVLLGGEHKIELLDGEKVSLKIEEGTQYGEEIKIKGKGIPSLNGDLFVRIIFNIPKKLSKKEKEIFGKNL